MKIIYHCYGGTHSSVTAAAVHLGILPLDRLPRPAELLAIPYFDAMDSVDHGRINFLGLDEYGNEVCFAGQRGSPGILENIIHGLAGQFSISPGSYKLVNVMYKVNISMKIGGVMSRRLRWVRLGRPLVVWGTVRAYAKITNLVRAVKAQVGWQQ